MKYKKGDIVCLFDGRTVYVFDVDNKKKNTKLAILKRKEHYLPLKRMKYL